MAEDAEIEKAAGVSSGGSKLVPVLLIVNVVLVVAMLAVFLFRGSGSSEKKEPAAEKGQDAKAEVKKPESALPGPTVKLADFVVHLRNVESDRYARLSLEVEVANEEDKNKVGALVPRIRDGFIGYLSDRTLEDFRGSEAIAKTKHALEDRLTELCSGVKIRGLYVTDLVIQ